MAAAVIRRLGPLDAAAYREIRAEGLDAVLLAVTAEAESARRLYARHGFTVYGMEPGALRIGDRAYDEELRIRRLT